MNRIFLCLVFLLLPYWTYAQTEAFYFIQVTDPQFGMIEENKGFTEETRLMEKAVVAINKLTPRFVVITGDMVNDGKDGNQIKEFKRIVGLINKGIPVYVTPGNHDLGQQFTEQRLQDYRIEYGYDCFSFKVNNTCFIGLNTPVIASRHAVYEPMQLVWLKQELLNAQQCNHRILFGHHPFFVNNPNEPDKYENIPLALRGNYLGLFTQYRVDYMFAGHLHHNAKGVSGNFNMEVSNAIGKALGKDKVGIRIIKVYADKVISDFYDLDAIPIKISL